MFSRTTREITTWNPTDDAKVKRITIKLRKNP